MTWGQSPSPHPLWQWEQPGTAAEHLATHLTVILNNSQNASRDLVAPHRYTLPQDAAEHPVMHVDMEVIVRRAGDVFVLPTQSERVPAPSFLRRGTGLAS
jgi:diadenosine tetraphosphate (Ap4A) HIT family hydrolase